MQPSFIKNVTVDHIGLNETPSMAWHAHTLNDLIGHQQDRKLDFWENLAGEIGFPHSLTLIIETGEHIHDTEVR